MLGDPTPCTDVATGKSPRELAQLYYLAKTPIPTVCHIPLYPIPSNLQARVIYSFKLLRFIFIS